MIHLWETLSNIGITDKLNTFDESIIQRYEESWNESIPIELLQKTQNSVAVTERITDEISALYSAQESLIIVQDTTVTNLMSKMIEMHVNLSEAIDILNKTTSVSEDVCNAQWKWLWKCKYQ